MAKPDFWLYIFNEWKYVSEIMLNLFAWNYFCLNVNLGNGNFKLFAKNEIQIANHPPHRVGKQCQCVSIKPLDEHGSNQSFEHS